MWVRICSILPTLLSALFFVGRMPPVACLRPPLAAQVAAARMSPAVALCVEEVAATSASEVCRLDGSTHLLSVTANDLNAWQLAVPLAADGSLNGQLLGRDLILMYLYAHIPVFLYLGWFFQRNGSLKNAWPPKF